MKKYFKIILSVFITLTAIGCDMDDDSLNVDLEGLAAPSDLGATFQITQDNTGVVTVIPTGSGVTQYSVDFGDGSPAADEIKPGETVTHVYAEGDYDVVITGTNLAGKTAQGTQPLTVSFRQPENLEVTIDLDVDGYTVSVSATADYAAMFDVYFGDVEGEEPTPLMIGETITYTYETIGTYDIRVVALSGGAATAEFSQSVHITGPTDPINFPITFDEPTVQYVPQEEGAVFGGASFSVVTNPDLSGANTEETNVGALTNGGNEWEGVTFTLDPPADFGTENKTVTMKVWSDQAVSVLLKFEGGLDGARESEVLVNHTGSGWEELSFDFGTNATASWVPEDDGMIGQPIVPTGEYSKMTIFVEGGKFTAGTFYLDDIDLLMEVLPKPEFPITFEATDIDYTWNGFGASDFGPIPAELIENPDPSGINTSATVLNIFKPSGAYGWAGASMDLAGPVDFTQGNTITMKVWSPRAGTPILFKMEDSNSPKDGNGNPTVFVEVQATTTVAGAWEELTFDLTSDSSFSTSIPYDRVIVFPDFNNGGNDEDFYFDDIVLSFPQPEFPITFEDPNVDYTWNGFGRSDFGPIPAQLVSNPDATGINTSGTVLEIEKLDGAYGWAGASMDLAGPVDFSAGTTVTVQVWSPRAGTPILFKMEDSNSPKDGNGNPTVFVEVQATTSVAGAWEELTFDLTSYNDFSVDIPYDRVILFPDFGNGGTGELFYFDNLQLIN